MGRIENYVSSVLENITADEKMKNRIKNDLTLHLTEASQDDDIDSVIKRMGSPREVAKEFMDSIYEDNSEVVERLTQERIKLNSLKNGCYEYKSRASFFGIPLVHIKVSRWGKPSVAKGIIAIGTISVGVLSIGAVPIGIISIGAIALGLISLGGLAIGLLLALGGLSIGAFALGGLSLGFGSIGGVAIGKIAVGGYAKGTVAVGATAVGNYTLQTNHIGPENSGSIYNLVKTAYPDIPEWIAKIFSGLNMNVR